MKSWRRSSRIQILFSMLKRLLLIIFRFTLVRADHKLLIRVHLIHRSLGKETRDQRRTVHRAELTNRVLEVKHLMLLAVLLIQPEKVVKHSIPLLLELTKVFLETFPKLSTQTWKFRILLWKQSESSIDCLLSPHSMSNKYFTWIIHQLIL